MARRTMTLKRIDPWSVLKFSLLANLVFLGILLLAGRVAWFVITRLELVDKVCEVAESVGFTDCGVNGGAVFQNALMLGILAVVVQTGIFVFLAFLHNLLAELTGGITVTLDDPNATVAPPAGRRAQATTAGSKPSGDGGARSAPVPGSSGSSYDGARAGTPTGAPARSSVVDPAPTAATPTIASHPTSGAEAGGEGDEDAQLFPHRRRLHGPERP